MGPEKASLRARVTGTVQGVGFRYFTKRVAGGMGVSGYVMNCHDGSVEVMAEGESETLKELLKLLKEGPRGARVEGVEETWGPYTGRFTEFSLRFGR